ncbi:MAG: hypothetical protein A3C50_03600 [Candidatus Staskawiczbacteria bacterium RIFCSPHIGHO2_02_FULL_43_16]|uniref:Glycosyltransferase 2-like domain-containing protein n=1 Tax=Candidatus Staskawiczbacteria bacterium RIFCSPHIGHO2_01_FULL_41_41 TaxID=1802203 RepID=A0A1G2HU46_9BACT|nr:MAG: hypothetical protein A2822_02705 [Candidatus Staskawiczbacteria bacterium RIFCSPHIGHO2_01_FULL_41_41]OGZ68021.1 MAG: hypothetical protein A3C50_03600 [Candidatus Staskawiczbacteria bacterium RIFCSPHIGHO2_02_FULL_43_16]OGZ74587.1 MAG: hypothetical protein A3A12_02400 [Candidatus Staskawiczbacteria bacterium RIFCSPLOWO2_01_FULL_43_17b]
MITNPLVSVIITTFNRKEILAKAIESALGQTYGNMEIIIADDGSTDGTYEAVIGLKEQHPQIVVFRNEKNLGFVKNLNKAVGLAQGKYIARLDDDDTWPDPQKLQKQVAFMEIRPEYVLTGGGVVRVDNAGREMIRFLLPKEDKDIKKAILADNVFAHSAVLFSKQAFMQVGGYDERFGFFADWALWMALGKIGKLYNFSEFFVNYFDQEHGGRSHVRDYQIRRKLRAKIILNNTYRGFYPGAKRALMLSFASYAYSFFPFREALWPTIFFVRKLVFGKPPYYYVINRKK